MGAGCEKIWLRGSGIFCKIYNIYFAKLNTWVSASRNYAETKTLITAVTKTKPKPKCELPRRNRNQAETKKFGSFGAETVTKTDILNTALFTYIILIIITIM